MSGWNNLRTIVESHAVQEVIDEARATYPRLDEAWEGLKWLLARAGDRLGVPPNNGDADLRLYVQQGDDLAEVPSLWIIFRIAPSEITIEAVKVAPYEPHEDADA